MQARLSTMFQSLQVRNYRLFASGQLLKLIGVWMMFIAQDWLVLELSGDSATALGVVVALQFTPVLLLTLISGRLADRYDKRMLLFVANTFWTVLSLAMSLLVLTGLVQLWHVFLFAALLGVANAVETPVRQAFVSELVGTRLLPNALSLNAAVFNSARIVGPAVAGLAIAAFDVGPVFLFTALSSIAPLVTVIQMRPAELYREPLPPRDERAAATVLDGLRYVGRRPDLLLPMVVMSVIGMSLFNFQLTLAALAKTVFNTGAASFGLFSTTLAAGALIGALAGTGRRSRPSVWLVLGAAIACATFGTLVGLAPAYWMVVALLPPTGFFMVYFAQAANQRVQLGTDAAFRGRVMALWVLVFLGTNPVGAPLIGWVAETFGAGVSIWAGGVLSLATALLALAWQLRRDGARLRFRVLPMPRFYITQT
ncbi:MFS transporter [Micromonospora endophytica]|uniref:MFS transporter n=1 Tax=Micromonospora endophytica TaxID=515350 RepID=A0A2W2CUP1_9ACTN|nr:MFS transporter [Micromonospora endophytica]PZF88776.1 MFS transporter [Micromonospora endophytica]RIW40972.1 MFS transporter [Micromonospora endophytica]BCJ58903.1 MFS transporter [Micromonospora endophytica]